MNKRILHHYQKRLRPISGWYFLIIAVIFFSVAAFALRQNNLRMIELREAVFQADEAGEDIEQPLRDLRRHVHGHMNTDLAAGDNPIRPPIQLKHQYERLVEKERARSPQSESLYEEAENHCEQRFPAGQLSNGRVQCVEKYITQNSAEPNKIPRELYQFDFYSPRWSPDLAGWSLVLGSIAGLVFIIRFALEFWLRRSLR